jgi:hypothetical protein
MFGVFIFAKHFNNINLLLNIMSLPSFKNFAFANIFLNNNSKTKLQSNHNSNLINAAQVAQSPY